LNKTRPVAPVLQVQDLHFAHAGQAPLFDGLSATLGPGLHWLQGESGSGKTTLLRLLAGELPCSGQLRLGDLLIEHDRVAWRAAVCLVDARQEAFDGLTPAALMAVVRQQHASLDGAIWQHHLDGFGLAPHAFKTLHMMSTGMRRKAALAAVLAAGCPLTLLDEPTAGLDSPAVAWLVQALGALGRQPRRAVLMACGHWPTDLPCAGTWALSPS
jgi:ABC-type multidrug transport system ATPase subunit